MPTTRTAGGFVTDARARVAATALTLAAGCGPGDGDSGRQGPWLVATEDLGAPRAQGASMDLTGGDAWWALAQGVPFLIYDNPGSDVPFTAWDLVLSERVSDVGTCPDLLTEGTSTVWRTYDCRSSQGYELSGEAQKTEWEDAQGWRYDRWDFDLQIRADVDDPRFDTLELDGSLLYVIGDGEALDRAVQVNLRTGLEGYWSRINATEPREALWTDWTLTARYEQTPDEVVRAEGVLDVGTLGAVGFATDALDRAAACTTAPDGTVAVTGAQSGTLVFNGRTACSTCAERTLDGEATDDLCRN